VKEFLKRKKETLEEEKRETLRDIIIFKDARRPRTRETFRFVSLEGQGAGVFHAQSSRAVEFKRWAEIRLFDVGRVRSARISSVKP